MINLGVEFGTFLLEYFYRMVGDYGIAIVCITCLVRVLLLPVNLMQRKQMKRQKALQERIEVIKKKCEKNEKKKNEELQKLYQSEKAGGLGCLLSILQFPVMIILYRSVVAVIGGGGGTILLPWVDSILSRDRIGLLPTATLFIQVLPQVYPYMPFFESLKIQKQPMTTIIPILLMNAMFVFSIPSGVGLYYFVSGLFSATEQFARYCKDAKLVYHKFN